jgi:hypothetical protein
MSVASQRVDDSDFLLSSLSEIEITLMRFTVEDRCTPTLSVHYLK